jgi:hypothetical protein
LSSFVITPTVFANVVIASRDEYKSVKSTVLPVRRKLLGRARGEDVTARRTAGFRGALVEEGRDRAVGMCARASSTIERIVTIEGGLPIELILAWSSVTRDSSRSIPLAALKEPLKIVPRVFSAAFDSAC